MITLNNIIEAKISQEFKFENIDETENYFIEDIKLNESVSNKHKKVWDSMESYRDHMEHLLILAYTVKICVSIFAFVSLVGIPVGIASSEIGKKICLVNVAI